ncbi:MAG: hypothetical protein ACRD2L_09500, partial [Terriglobia bacterium]
TCGRAVRGRTEIVEGKTTLTTRKTSLRVRHEKNPFGSRRSMAQVGGWLSFPTTYEYFRASSYGTNE